ncbi:MAG: hypothetical protein JRN09_04435 [Nitrososphaerota archaeon]|nr:hypothetical protein [Nitrososphaerota archaeon]
MKLLVGTLKGGFILESDSARRNWKLNGPHFDGFETYDMVADTSGGKPLLYAAVNTWTWGPIIYKSRDGGRAGGGLNRVPGTRQKTRMGSRSSESGTFSPMVMVNYTPEWNPQACSSAATIRPLGVDSTR